MTNIGVLKWKETYSEDKTLPCTKEAQFIASSLSFLPIRGQKCSAYLDLKETNNEQVEILPLTHINLFF